MQTAHGSSRRRFWNVLHFAGCVALLYMSVGCGGGSTTSGNGGAPTDNGVRLARNVEGTVTGITFYGADVTDNDVKILDKHPALKTVTFLDCSGVSDAAMNSVRSQTELESLTINNTGIGDDGFLMLTPGLWPSLKAMNLSNLPLTDKGMAGLAAAPNCEEIELFGLYVGDDSLKVLGEMAQLRQVALQNCPKLTGTGLSFLKKLPSLKMLDLRGTKISSEGLQELGQLTQLEGLLLDPESATDEAMKYVGQISSLKTFECIRVEVSDAGLAHLQTLQQLKELTFDKCDHITDEGLVHLHALKSLVRLHLTECPKVTNDGMKHLEGMQHLRSLSVADSPVTEPTLRQLQATIPECRIFFGVTPGGRYLQ